MLFKCKSRSQGFYQNVVTPSLVFTQIRLGYWAYNRELGFCNLYYLTLIFLGIQEVCEAERALGIMWTKTGAGHYSRHPCPREAKGRGDPRGRTLRRTRGQGHKEETKHRF